MISILLFFIFKKEGFLSTAKRKSIWLPKKLVKLKFLTFK